MQITKREFLKKLGPVAAAARQGAKVALAERYGSLGGLFTNGRIQLMTAHGNRHVQPTVDPEAAKYLMDAMIAKAGVEMFFHSRSVDVIQDGSRVRGVVFDSKQGRQAILAKQVFDRTCDGDVAFAAGANYRQITRAMGFVTRLGNIDRVAAKKHPVDSDGNPLEGVWPMKPNEPSGTAGWYGRLGPKGNGLDVRVLSKAEGGHCRYWWETVRKRRSA